MVALFKVAAVAVTAVLMACVLRRGTAEISLLLLLAAGVWMLMLVSDALERAVEMLLRLAQLSQLEGNVLEPVLKTVALSIVTRITGEVCRSAGEGGIAAFVETAGTVLALAASLPLCEAVVQMIVGMLG